MDLRERPAAELHRPEEEVSAAEVAEWRVVDFGGTQEFVYSLFFGVLGRPVDYEGQGPDCLQVALVI